MDSSGNIHRKKNHIVDEYINITEDDENEKGGATGGVVGFHDVEALTRGGGDDDNSNNNNGGSHHKKSSKEQNYGESTVDTSATGNNEGGHSLAGYSLRDGGNNNAGTTGTSFIHSKSSDSDNNFTPPTQHPTPKPTHLFANSLREWHQPKSSDPSEGYSITHAKQSQEKNAQNQNVVNYQWSTDSPTRMPTTTTEEVNGVQAVARAQDDYDEAHNSNSEGANGIGANGGCEADENGAFFNGLQVRNGGAVLRYQYELIQDIIDNDDTNDNSSVEDVVVDELLRKEIIPKLEGGITNALIPIFFEECLNHSKQNFEGRALLLSGGNDNDGLLRHRRLNKVVGIDAKPNDFPLVRSECKSEPIPNSKCHRVEGALTLYFPPNYTLSTLLSSAALSTLRAIEQGMNDGSLANSHEDIRKLHFLQSSYNLQPKPIPYDGIDTVNIQDDGGAKEGGNNVGLILGILLPLLFILGCCCCGCAGVYYWKKRQYPDNAHDEHDYEVSNSSTEESIMNAKLQRNHEEDSDTDLEDGTDQDDTTDDDDQGTTTSDSEDDNSTDGSTSSRSKSATSTSDSNSDSDSSNSDEDSEEERDFFPANPLDPIFEEAERERARKKKMKRRHARIKRRYERMNRNKNIVMTGDDHNNKAECDDNMSVMTGATGMHSVSSVATSRIKNNNIGR